MTTAPERRRLIADVVVDAGPSMVVWRPLVDAIPDLLRDLGLFDDIRVRYLHTGSDGMPGLHSDFAPGDVSGLPVDLAEPGTDQVVFVVSDGVDAKWHGAAVHRLLDAWSGRPLAILQPLPQRLWRRTGLVTGPVRIGASEPMAATADLRVTGRPRLSGGKPVPVYEIEPDRLAEWARLMRGTGDEEVHAVVAWTRPSSKRGALVASEAADAPADRVARFKSASPQAYKLAGYLSVVPLTLPVMRKVQQFMLPDSKPFHLAEVFNSGLLHVVGRASADPDLTRYEFDDGVRGVLLGTIRRSEATRVAEEVNAFVEGDRPFASFAPDVLRRLGRAYAEFAPTPVADRARSPRLPEHLELLLTDEPVLDIYAYGPWRVPDGLYEEIRERVAAYRREHGTPDLGSLLGFLPGAAALRGGSRGNLGQELLSGFSTVPARDPLAWFTGSGRWRPPGFWVPGPAGESRDQRARMIESERAALDVFAGLEPLEARRRALVDLFDRRAGDPVLREQDLTVSVDRLEELWAADASDEILTVLPELAGPIGYLGWACEGFDAAHGRLAAAVPGTVPLVEALAGLLLAVPVRTVPAELAVALGTVRYEELDERLRASRASSRIERWRRDLRTWLAHGLAAGEADACRAWLDMALRITGAVQGLPGIATSPEHELPIGAFQADLRRLFTARRVRNTPVVRRPPRRRRRPTRLRFAAASMLRTGLPAAVVRSGLGEAARQAVADRMALGRPIRLLITGLPESEPRTPRDVLPPAATEHGLLNGWVPVTADTFAGLSADEAAELLRECARLCLDERLLLFLDDLEGSLARDRYGAAVANELRRLMADHPNLDVTALCPAGGERRLFETDPALLRAFRTVKARTPAPAQAQAPDPFAELDAFVGIEPVKREIEAVAAQARAGLLTRPWHLVFLGGPGTGKGTVAGVLGRLFADLGMLGSGHLVEVRPDDLADGSAAEIGRKVRGAVRRASGGVLLVRDAHRLGTVRGEVTTALVDAERAHGDDLLVVLAGPDAELTRTLQARPDLAVRFPKTIRFPDLTADDLAQIFARRAADGGFALGDGVLEKVRVLIRGTPRAGNAGVAVGLLDRAVAAQGRRVLADGKVDETESLDEILATDLPATLQPGGADDAPSLDELLAGIDTLVWPAGVKDEVVRLVEEARAAARRRQSLGRAMAAHRHLVFTGNPGTARTTVARLIGSVYHRLGLLSSGHLVEVGRADLLGPYIGQTAPRTRAAVDRALGGVLFIDEAHLLAPTRGAPGDFGHEALTELLTQMERHADDLVVIVSGGRDEMDPFLGANPGLASRFPTTLHFPDYSDDELVALFAAMATGRGFTLADGLLDDVRRLLSAARRDASLGNALLVESVLETAIFGWAGRRSGRRSGGTDDSGPGPFDPAGAQLLRAEDLPRLDRGQPVFRHGFKPDT